jgi:hypothetical protein
MKELSNIIPKENISLKQNTGHIVIKGRYVPLLREWLTKQGF